MAIFKKAYEKTNHAEGGAKISMVREDSGNWTGGKVGVGTLVGSKYGVAAPTLSAFLGRTVTVNDMANLSAETAMVIAKKNYWDKMRGDEINDQEIAERIYDRGYNMGMAEAIREAQHVLGIPETGKVDSLTLNALNFKHK